MDKEQFEFIIDRALYGCYEVWHFMRDNNLRLKGYMNVDGYDYANISIYPLVGGYQRFGIIVRPITLDKFQFVVYDNEKNVICNLDKREYSDFYAGLTDFYEVIKVVNKGTNVKYNEEV